MRRWVHPDDVLEPSARDLAVIVGISPTTQSTPFVLVEHRRMLGVEGILYTFLQNVESLGEVSKDVPRVQSQYGVTPV